MYVEDIRMLYAYNRWAMQRLFRLLVRIDPSIIERRLGGSFPTIGATLYHIVTTEWLWLQRWQGISPNELPDASQLFSVARIDSFWHSIDSRRSTYLNGLREAQLNADVEYRNLGFERFTLPLGQLLVHCVNHSTHHRGQITGMLRQAGAVPVPLDMLHFFLETNTHAAPVTMPPG